MKMYLVVVLLLCICPDINSGASAAQSIIEEDSLPLNHVEIPLIQKTNSWNEVQYGRRRSEPTQLGSSYNACQDNLQLNTKEDEEADKDALKCIKKSAQTTGKMLLQILNKLEGEVTNLDDYENFANKMGTVYASIIKLMRDYEDKNQLVYNLNNASDVFMTLDINVASEFMPVINCTKQLSSATTISHQIGGAFLEAQLFTWDSLAIYAYLPTLFDALSDYKIQSDKTIVYDFDADSLSIPELESKLKIKVPHSLSLINLNLAKKTNIINILNATLTHKTEISCASGKTTVTGSFVMLSEVVSDSCLNSSSQIEIYAATKLFIDADLTKQGGHIAMASPIWDVQGNRHISLDGADGLPKSKAKYNSLPGSTGIAGQPGHAGDSGGEFFGIGQLFVNGEKLVITAKGGNGGKGEEGGDAFNWSASRSNYMPCYIKFYYKATSGYVNVPDCKAANGGAGGVGGKPGPGGFVNVWALEDDASATIDVSSGVTGAGGSGGYAGEVYVHEYYYSESNRFTIDQLLKGSQGTGNSNSAGIEPSKPQITPVFPSMSFILQFKKTLRKFESVALEGKQKVFLETLENHNNVQKLYSNSLPFFEEFEGLEVDYRFKERNSTIYFNSLLRRAVNFTCDGGKDANCQDMRYLRLALMSILAEGSDEYFVVNVRDYLALLLKQIQQYHASIRELNIIQKNEDYISDLLNDIIAAKNFIAQDVLPKIEDVSGEMKTQMNDLVEEVKQHLQDAEALKKELEKQKQKMKKLGFLNVLFNIGGFLSNALSFIPGAGVLGTVLGVGFDVGSSIISDNIDKIKQSAVEAEGNIDSVFIAQQVFLQKHLNELLTDIGSDQTTDNQVQFVKFEIEEFKKALEYTSSDFLRAKEKIKSAILEFKNSAQYGNNVKYCLSPRSNNTDGNDYVERLSSIIEAAGDGFQDIFNAVGQNNDAKNELDKAIQETANEIAALKSYENIIYNTLMPMIDQMKNSMTNAVNQTDLSHVEIDVQGMKIDAAITDIKVEIEAMVYTFEDPIIMPTLTGCIDKLRSAMKTAMSIFDRMANFRDQAKLINYITEIQSDNSGLTTRQLSYEILTKTNLITKEFGRGIRAFQQFSFPFASLYLDRYDIPQSVLESQNDSMILNAVTAQIDFLVDELVIEATVVRNQGYTIFPDVNFDASSKDQPPFYVWKNKHNKVEISQLLQGKQVTLTAELPANEVYANAIKFKEIGIHFISSNKTIQNKLDKKIDDFLITMTHLGSSYFQCTDKKFVIYHNKIKMVHGMTRVDNDYGVADINTIILRSNPAMCSPYTTWLMQISHKQGCLTCFGDLEKFVDEDLDLALEGDGQFIDIPDGKDVCGDISDKYYERVDVVQ